MNTALRAAFAGLALVLACGASAADRKNKVSSGDRSFITKAMKDDATEIELGKLAQQNGGSAEVKRFGDHLVKEHSKAGDELQAIAAKLGYSPRNAGPDKGKVKKFSNLRGARFDREFAHFMVKDHERSVKLFEKESQKGQAEELRQFAAKTLPGLQEHLKMARDLKVQDKPKKS